MPFSPKNTVFALLIATLTSSCASQNAMNLVPDALKLDIARDRAARADPVSITDMLSKARAGDMPKAAAEGVVLTAPPSGKSATSVAPIAPPLDGATYGRNGDSRPGNGTGTPARQLRSNASEKDDLGASEMFQTALNMQGDQMPNHAGRNVSGAQWLKILEQAQLDAELEPSPDSANGEEASSADQNLTTAALPEVPAPGSEVVEVNLDASLSGLSREDDLRVRLLRHGRRHPQMILIGKVADAKGFDALQRALSLGRIIVGASGGNPGISYDPAMPPLAAKLLYASPVSAQ